MNRFFVCLFALVISFSTAAASAEWVTVCDGNSCHREWRGPVQRVQENRAYRQSVRQSYGSSGQSGYCRSMGGRWRVSRSYGSYGGNVSQGSQGGYSTPSYSEPAQEKATVPASKPVTFERPKPSIKTCTNPACNCVNCKCEDCDCGQVRVPPRSLAAAQKYLAKLPDSLADYKRERDSFRVPKLNPTGTLVASR